MLIVQHQCSLDFLSYVVWLSNTKWCTTATKIHKLQQLIEEWKHENYKHLKKIEATTLKSSTVSLSIFSGWSKKAGAVAVVLFSFGTGWEKKKKAADASQQRSSPPTASRECQQQGYSSCSGSVVSVVAQKSLILNPKRSYRSAQHSLLWTLRTTVTNNAKTYGFKV